MYAVEVYNVSRRFNDVKALDQLSFKIPHGDFVLLLGHNGSGKTTLLRCMLGLINFEGEIKIMGIDVKKRGKEARRYIGYLPQSLSLYDDMTCYQLIDFMSDLRGVTVKLEEVLAPIGLMEKAHSKIGGLSGGMKQRLALATALLNNPEILLLDEPFSNLDTRSKIEVIEILKMLKNRRRTIIVSTHTISGLLPIADKIILMNRGRVAEIIDAHDFIKIVAPSYRIHIRTVDNPREKKTTWKTFTTSNLHDTLIQLQNEGIDFSDVIIEEPAVDEIVNKFDKGGAG